MKTLDNQRFIRKVEELNQLIRAILPPSEVDHLAKFVNKEASYINWEVFFANVYHNDIFFIQKLNA